MSTIFHSWAGFHPSVQEPNASFLCGTVVFAVDDPGPTVTSMRSVEPVADRKLSVEATESLPGVTFVSLPLAVDCRFSMVGTAGPSSIEARRSRSSMWGSRLGGSSARAASLASCIICWTSFCETPLTLTNSCPIRLCDTFPDRFRSENRPINTSQLLPDMFSIFGQGLQRIFGVLHTHVQGMSRKTNHCCRERRRC